MLEMSQRIIIHFCLRKVFCVMTRLSGTLQLITLWSKTFVCTVEPHQEIFA